MYYLVTKDGKLLHLGQERDLALKVFDEHPGASLENRENLDALEVSVKAGSPQEKVETKCCSHETKENESPLQPLWRFLERNGLQIKKVAQNELEECGREIGKAVAKGMEKLQKMSKP